MRGDDTFADGETETDAGGVLFFAFIGDEECRDDFGVDSFAVIADGEVPYLVDELGLNFDSHGSVGAAMADGVFDEVLEDSGELDGVADDLGHFVDDDDGVTFFEDDIEIFEGLVDGVADIDFFSMDADAAGSGEGEHLVDELVHAFVIGDHFFEELVFTLLNKPEVDFIFLEGVLEVVCDEEGEIFEELVSGLDGFDFFFGFNE